MALPELVLWGADRSCQKRERRSPAHKPRRQRTNAIYFPGHKPRQYRRRSIASTNRGVHRLWQTTGRQNPLLPANLGQLISYKLYRPAQQTLLLREPLLDVLLDYSQLAELDGALGEVLA